MREETLGSAITCLIGSLRSSTSIAVLDESLSTIKTVVQSAIPQVVELSLYEAVTHFIVDVVERRGENDASEENVDFNSGPNPIGRDSNDGSKFLHKLILAVFGDSSTQPSVAEPQESLRTARISLVAKFISQPMLSLASREVLRNMLKLWHEQERSRPVRLQIEKALEVDDTFRTR